MKIVINNLNSSYGELSQQLVIDGLVKETVTPLHECPEDACIGRSLISCSTIADYMKQSYEAGKNGEPFDLSEKNVEELE